MPKPDFTHLRVTPAQAREFRAVLNARQVLASWERPFEKARAAAAAATVTATAAGKTATGSPDGSGWDRAMQKAVLSQTRRRASDRETVMARSGFRHLGSITASEWQMLRGLIAPRSTDASWNDALRHIRRVTGDTTPNAGPRRDRMTGHSGAQRRAT